MVSAGVLYTQGLGFKSLTHYIMKEEISEYYKEKGFSAVYIAVNKEPRRVATLRKLDKTMTK